MYKDISCCAKSVKREGCFMNINLMVDGFINSSPRRQKPQEGSGGPAHFSQALHYGVITTLLS